MTPVGWVRRVAGPIRRVASRLFSESLAFLGMTSATFVISLDKPIYVQYWRHLVNVLHGDFDSSLLAFAGHRRQSGWPVKSMAPRWYRSIPQGEENR
jgi:hypothetical protein